MRPIFSMTSELQDLQEQIAAMQIKDLAQLCAALDDLRKPAKKTKR